MSLPKTSPWHIVLVLTLSTGAVAFGFWKFFHHSEVIVEGVRPSQQGVGGLTDMSVAEAGSLAGPQYWPIRQAYLQNLEQYRAMCVVPLTTDVTSTSESLLLPLTTATHDDESNHSWLCAVPPKVMKGLADKVALTLCRAAGMELGAYEAHLGANEEVAVPLGYQSAGSSPVVGSGGVGSTVVGSGSVAHAEFETLYRKSCGDSGSPNRLTAVSLSGRGFKVAIQSVSEAEADDMDIMSDRLSKSERAFYRGMLAHGALIFHQQPHSHPVSRPGGETVLLSTIIAIVEDATHDRYPFWMSFRYDAPSDRWWLIGASQMVSVRLAKYDRLPY